MLDPDPNPVSQPGLLRQKVAIPVPQGWGLGSVADLCHFDVDPDPANISSLTFTRPTKN
jgi:hypothetical protein